MEYIKNLILSTPEFTYINDKIDIEDFSCIFEQIEAETLKLSNFNGLYDGYTMSYSIA